MKKAVKVLAFLLLLGLLLHGADELLFPKNYALTSEWPASSNTEGVYRLEKNSLDLLILGSSKAYTAFVPQILYDEYGVRAYTLGTDLQSPHMSYYWLREGLKRQSPELVVLEASMFFPVIADQPLNTSEAMMRKALDPMRWSFNKLHALWELYRLDKTQNWKSYVFPNLRFHERWKEWSEDDFTLPELRAQHEQRRDQHRIKRKRHVIHPFPAPFSRPYSPLSFLRRTSRSHSPARPPRPSSFRCPASRPPPPASG